MPNFALANKLVTQMFNFNVRRTIMKKMTILAMMMTIAISASAMSFSQARSEALFLSDKMAYELNLTDDQYDAVYEINLDYLMSVNGRYDAYGTWWNRRNTDLQYVLTVWQYNKYKGLSYFYRPLTWKNGGWMFNVYSHYSNHNHLYKSYPKTYPNHPGEVRVTRGNGHSGGQPIHSANNHSGNNHSGGQSSHNGNNHGGNNGGGQPSQNGGVTVHRGARG